MATTFQKEREAQELQNKITLLRKNLAHDDHVTLQELHSAQLKLNALHSELATGGACDRAGN